MQACKLACAHEKQLLEAKSGSTKNRIHQKIIIVEGSRNDWFTHPH